MEPYRRRADQPSDGLAHLDQLAAFVAGQVGVLPGERDRPRDQPAEQGAQRRGDQGQDNHLHVVDLAGRLRQNR